jgi:hypothetical protein
MMKLRYTLPTALLLLSACVYDVPLSDERIIAVEPALLGLWEALPEEGAETGSGPEQLRVFQFSNTEYMVQHTDEGSSLYFRAWTIEVGGVRAMQMQWIGDQDEPVGEDKPGRYMVLSYNLGDQGLEVKGLNTEIIPEDTADTRTMQEAFIANRDREDLWSELVIYQKVMD